MTLDKKRKILYTDTLHYHELPLFKNTVVQFSTSFKKTQEFSQKIVAVKKRRRRRKSAAEGVSRFAGAAEW